MIILCLNARERDIKRSIDKSATVFEIHWMKPGRAMIKFDLFIGKVHKNSMERHTFSNI
jgi:hypothetical protein